MMDPGSIITIIDTSWKIITYIKDVRYARSEREQLNKEIFAVLQVFCRIRDEGVPELEPANATRSPPETTLTGQNGIFAQLDEVLADIKHRLNIKDGEGDSPSGRGGQEAESRQIVQASSLAPSPVASPTARTSDGLILSAASFCSRFRSHTIHSVETSKQLFNDLKWPFEKSEVKSYVDRLRGLLQVITAAISQATLTRVSLVQTAISYVHNATEAKELTEVLNWISPLDFRAIQESPQKRPVDGTCHWFFRRSSVQAWAAGELPIIWCQGIPGAGKTLMASAAFNHMQDRLKGQKAVVLVAFSTYDDPQTHTALALLSSMLRQAVRAQGKLSRPIRELRARYRSGLNHGRPQMDVIRRALMQELYAFDRVFIILDGLDEMLLDGESVMLLQAVQTLRPGVRVLMTSRPVPAIRKWFTTRNPKDAFHIDAKSMDRHDFGRGEGCADCEHHAGSLSETAYQCADCGRTFCRPCYTALHSCSGCGRESIVFPCMLNRSVIVAAQGDDIKLYIKWRIASSSLLQRYIKQAGDEGIDLPKMITDRLLKESDQMFLLAKFHIDYLEEQFSAGEVIEALSSLPVELDAHYNQVFQRISTHRNAAKVKHFISIVAAAASPLSSGALKHALAVRTGDANLNKLHMPDIDDLASLCLGLVVVDGTGFVRFAHETIGRYMRNNSDQVIKNGHSLLARACLTYLCFSAFSAGACSDNELTARRKQYPFLSYAAAQWGEHVARSTNPDIQLLAMSFLFQKTHVEAAVQCLATPAKTIVNRGATALHLTAHFGLLESAVQLLATGVNVNPLDHYGATPLMYAVINNHRETAELLLRQPGVDVNRVRQGPLKQNVLHQAMVRSSLELVTRILDHSEMDLDFRDACGKTALILAAARDRPRTLEAFLAKGAAIELQDNEGGLALMRACENGHLRIVEILLRHGANRCARDPRGRNVLHRCALNNHPPVLRYLLENPDGLNPNDQSHGGRTPLHDAARMKHVECARILLQAGGRTDILDKEGHSPAKLALDARSRKCLELLKEARQRELEREAADTECFLYSGPRRVNTFGSEYILLLQATAGADTSG